MTQKEKVTLGVIGVSIIGIAIIITIGVLRNTSNENDNSDSDTAITDNTQEEEENKPSTTDDSSEDIQVIMFHNGTGPMCIDAIEFFENENISYEEHLTTDDDFVELLEEYKLNHEGDSEGVSPSFGYYPMIFIGDKAFSGFNDEIGNEIEEILDK
ncbi:hypothetical protein JW710_00630 [Candidatus Dojkabacteria bacterium]|nr:hypothetical protein [Candidatus Dojkabacteria bacterium]